MNILEAAPYLALALATITFVGQIKSFFSSGEKQLAADIAKSETEIAGAVEKLVEHDRRIQSIESDLKHLPDRDMAHRLEIGMEKVSGRLDTLDERLKPIDNLSRRLQEFLIEQAGKK